MEIGADQTLTTRGLREPRCNTPRPLCWLASSFYTGPMDVAGFDLNLLKAFDVLYSERHVTRAGQQIGLSQPAMGGPVPLA